MNSWSNDDLARLLRPQPGSAPLEQAPGLPRKTLVANGQSAAKPRALQAVPQPSLQEMALAAQPLSEDEIRDLFFALRRGTEARLQRKPTAAELQMLVEAVNKARQLGALADAALRGSFDVYWDGADWAFESPAQAASVQLDLAA